MNKFGGYIIEIAGKMAKKYSCQNLYILAAISYASIHIYRIPFRKLKRGIHFLLKFFKTEVHLYLLLIQSITYTPQQT